MWATLFGAWLSISPLQGQSDTTSVVVIEWWSGVGVSWTNDIAKYTITDSVINYKTYSLTRIDSIVEADGYVIKPKNTYLYTLVTEKLPHKKFLYCIVQGYGVDYFYHYGFVPNILDKPRGTLWSK